MPKANPAKSVLQRRDAESAEFNATKRFAVEVNGKPERVILTRRRGVAEVGRQTRQDQNERGDSGGRSEPSDGVSGKNTRRTLKMSSLRLSLCSLRLCVEENCCDIVCLAIEPVPQSPHITQVPRLGRIVPDLTP
jgi:hypothetical protein